MSEAKFGKHVFQKTYIKIEQSLLALEYTTFPLLKRRDDVASSKLRSSGSYRHRRSSTRRRRRGHNQPNTECNSSSPSICPVEPEQFHSHLAGTTDHSWIRTQYGPMSDVSCFTHHCWRTHTVFGTPLYPKFNKSLVRADKRGQCGSEICANPSSSRCCYGPEHDLRRSREFVSYLEIYGAKCQEDDFAMYHFTFNEWFVCSTRDFHFF